MSKKLSKKHRAVIIGKIEESIDHLETHMDDILKESGVKIQCRITKTGRTVRKKK